MYVGDGQYEAQVRQYLTCSGLLFFFRNSDRIVIGGGEKGCNNIGDKVGNFSLKHFDVLWLTNEGLNSEEIDVFDVKRCKD